MKAKAAAGAKAPAKAKAKAPAKSKATAKAAPKATSFKSKAAPNKAKAAYKAASSKAREAKMMAGGRTSTKGLKGRTDAGAQRIRESVKVAQAAASRVRAMERNRGRKRSNRKK